MGQDNTSVQENIQKLSGVLGHDVTKGVRITSSALEQAAKEIAEEQSEKSKARAKELLVKAQELVTQITGARKKFEAEENKAGKELAKLMNQINNVADGKPANAPAENATEAEAADAETPAE